jgi:hypothetical protein
MMTGGPFKPGFGLSGDVQTILEWDVDSCAEMFRVLTGIFRFPQFRHSDRNRSSQSDDLFRPTHLFEECSLC